MSDLADWPEDWRETVFQEMSKYPRNTYIFLTKRPQLIDIDVRNMPWMWMGCTVTNRSDVQRIQQMKQHMKASNYHVTFEPLHGDVGIIDLSGIKWVVIGAETGIRSGRIIPKKDWVMNIVEQADRRNIPVFMKDSLFSIVGEENFRQDDFPWL
jgi:protein gp37